MLDLLEQIIEALVDSPDDVLIQELAGEGTTIFLVRVAEADRGVVIGRAGQMADAIRTLAGAIGGKNDRRYVVEFDD